MRVWLIQTGEPLPLKNNIRKMRTALLADKLLSRGHSIFWWASAFEHQQKVMISEKDKKFDIFERYSIMVLRGCRYRKNISLARYIDHQIVAIKFRIQANRFPKPDVIVASMPDHLLAYEVARYARKNRIPLIVDIRDLWPDTFIDRFRNIGLHGLGKIALSLDFARLAFLLKSADALVAMSKGILQWGLDKIEKTESLFDKVFYLGYQKNNSRISANLGGSLDLPDWLKGREEQKIFLFIGTFGVSYELELILDAANRFEKLGKDNICFILAGTGEKFDLISKKATGLKNVVLPGWIDQKEISVL